MNNEELQHLRELLRAYQNRLRVLELQAAQFGINAPPQVLTEINSLRSDIIRVNAEIATSTPAVTREAYRQLRQKALKAYYSHQWSQAEDLLIQVLSFNLHDDDIQTKLSIVQHNLDLQAFYQSICEMRNEGHWQAALKALEDLDQQQPGYGDPEGIRLWALEQRQQSAHVLQSSQEAKEQPAHSAVVTS
jgi:hypothetical protein